MSDDEVILRARGLSIGYGRRVVLRDVEMEVRRGERWFIVGPNGQGKTTLLRAILGLIPAPGLYRHPDHVRHENLGFVPQRCELNASLPTTVREFVLLGLVGQRVSRAARAQRLTESLQQVGLEPLVDKDYFSLSGGQRQRALLARALVRRPRVLLLDEPAGGLDLTAEKSLMDALMQSNARESLTMLFVTHNVELAACYATHVALVYDTHVRAGPVEEVFRTEWLREAYRVPILVGREPGGEINVRLEASA